MKDGSDAVSDWPLLNALLNTAGGATWVSLHHGGGVGMGYSQHSGVVIVCDGTDARQAHRARALERPGTGVMRHADAGYDSAVACAQASRAEAADGRGLNVHWSVPWAADAGPTAGHPRRRRQTQPEHRPGARRRIRPAPRGAARGRRRRAGLRRQHRLRQAGQHAHQHRADLATLQLNLIRSHSVGVGEPLAPPVVRLMLALKAGQPGARPLGRAAGGDRHAARRAQRRPGALCAGAGLGRRLGRPGAAGAHDAGAAGRGRDAGGRPRAARRRGRCSAARHRAAGAAGQGRPGADQRHADLHRAGAARAVLPSSRCWRRRWSSAR
jgi:hypothetical protein